MRLFRLTLACSAFVFSLAAQGTQQISGPLTDQRIIELVRAGVRTDELIRLIATAREVSFDLTPSATDNLMRAGVSEEMIKAMAAREQGAIPSEPTAPRSMRTSASPSVSADSSSSSPESIPRFVIFAGGSFVRMHASGAEASQVVGLPDYYLERRNLNFNLYGWDTTLTENVNGWFGIDADASGFYGMPKPTFLCSASSIFQCRVVLV